MPAAPLCPKLINCRICGTRPQESSQEQIFAECSLPFRWRALIADRFYRCGAKLIAISSM